MEGDPDRNIPDELGPFRLLKEELRTESGTVYTTSGPGHYRVGHPPDSLSVKVEESAEPEFQVATDQPVLTQYVTPGRTRRMLNDQHATDLRAVLADMRFWEPSPDRMREPSFPGATVLGDFGDNLATALQEIRADSEQAETLASWVRELTPMGCGRFRISARPQRSGPSHDSGKEQQENIRL